MPAASEATRYAKRKELWVSNPTEKERQLASWRENSRNYRKRKRPGTCTTQNSEYSDLRSIRRAWQSLSIRNPLRQIGLDVLDKIPQSSQSLAVVDVPFESVTPDVLFRDLPGRGVYWNLLGNCRVDGVSFAEFMAGWNALEENLGTDVTEYTRIPYAAIDVPATENGGISLGIQVPTCLTEQDVYVRSDETGSFEMSTTLAPAGTILDGHLNIGTGSVLTTLFGTNVVFTWHRTAENLSWMESRFGVNGPIMLPFLMDDLVDVSVTILNKNQAVQLDSGVIYAVMSPNNSAFSRWEFVKASWCNSSDVHDCLLWSADLLNKRRTTPLAVLAPLGDLQSGLERELDMWERLAEKLRFNGEVETQRFLDMVISVRNIVDTSGRQ